jgi:hypothetical protein
MADTLRLDEPYIFGMKGVDSQGRRWVTWSATRGRHCDICDRHIDNGWHQQDSDLVACRHHFNVTGIHDESSPAYFFTRNQKETTE